MYNLLVDIFAWGAILVAILAMMITIIEQLKKLFKLYKEKPEDKTENEDQSLITK